MKEEGATKGGHETDVARADGGARVHGMWRAQSSDVKEQEIESKSVNKELEDTLGHWFKSQSYSGP